MSSPGRGCETYLGAGSCGGDQVAIEDVVPAEHVCNEDTMELRFLKHFGEINPMIHVVEVGRMVVRMSPETRRLMSAACILSIAIST